MLMRHHPCSLEADSKEIEHGSMGAYNKEILVE